MIDVLIDFPQEESTPEIQTCRHQHQTWATTLTGNEQEIGQLLTLLAELPNENYRRLQPYIVDFAEALSRLKVRMNRLGVDVVCNGGGCSSPNSLSTCADPRFISSMTENPLISSVSVEFSRTKERCDAFFGELMMLNLI